jgi:hypothetical protein
VKSQRTTLSENSVRSPVVVTPSMTTPPQSAMESATAEKTPPLRDSALGVAVDMNLSGATPTLAWA